MSVISSTAPRNCVWLAVVLDFSAQPSNGSKREPVIRSCAESFVMKKTAKMRMIELLSLVSQQMDGILKSFSCSTDLGLLNEDRVYHLPSRARVPLLIATIAFFLISWTTVEPISFALAVSTVPLCCQKNGKHHCTAIAQAEPETNGPSLRPASPLCPHRTRTLALSRHFQSEPNSAAASFPLQSHLALLLLDPAYRHSRVERGLFERGPPAHSLLLSL
jgi:hypothetical protein